MAIEYGFTPKEKQTYFTPEKVYSSFGRDTDDDFIALFVYQDEKLVKKIFLDASEVGLDAGENYLDLNIGQHLRDNGLTDGTYDVTYKFLRRLAGVENKVFVDNKGLIYEGKVKEKTINGETRFFATSNSDENDKVVELELFKRDLTYVIDDISPDRTEAIIEVDEIIQNEEYKEDFLTMSEMIEYKPLRINGAGPIKFDEKDPYVLEFDIDTLDRGFTQNMVGGQIVIPKLYKTEITQVTTNEDIILEEIDEVDFIEPEPIPDPSPNEPEPEVFSSNVGGGLRS